MLRPLLPLLLAPLLGSCQPPDILVRAVFFGNALAFVAVDSGDSESIYCWREGAVVDASLRPAWQFGGPAKGDCRKILPIHYGRPPEGTDTSAGPARLEPGRLYLLTGNAVAHVRGAFSFTRSGDVWMVHNVDPDSPAAAAIQQAWWNRRNHAPPEPEARP